MSDAPTKACPFCAETILAAAVKCKHCGSDLSKSAPPAPRVPLPTGQPRRFTAHRLTEGNFLFPASIELHADRVVRSRDTLLGKNEKIIPLSHVAGVQVKRIGSWGAIRIEATSGDYIAVKGLKMVEIEEIRAFVESRRRG